MTFDSGKKRICLAITEPSAGSDVKRLETTAKKTADGRFYIVTGAKKWITNGIWSDYFSRLPRLTGLMTCLQADARTLATAVRTSGKPGEREGVSILLIPRTEGVETRKMFVGYYS